MKDNPFGKLVIREVRLEDLSSITELLNSMYALKRPEVFFRWQFFDNPNPLKIICATLGNKLVGIAGMQKRKLTNGMTGAQASWLNVAPQFAGKGYFKTLMREAALKIGKCEFSFVFANAIAKRAMQGSLGYSFIGDIFFYELTGAERIKAAEDYSIEEITCSVSLPRRTPWDKRFLGFDDDDIFYRWRYGACPLYRYNLVRYKDCFAVYKIFRSPSSKECAGDIVDYWCPGWEAEKLEKLLSIVCKEVYLKKIKRITTWSFPDKLLSPALQNIGFKRTSVSSHFGIKIVNEGKNSSGINDFSRWCLKQSDATNY